MSFVKVTDQGTSVDDIVINLDRISEICISKSGENFSVRISYDEVNAWSSYLLNEEDLAKIETAMGLR
jgi:hypothetical protein